MDDFGAGTAMSKLNELRAALKAQGLHGFIVTNSDEYQSEYAHPSARRIAALCGFTGSIGTAAVTHDKAAVFIDGRYTLQAEQEVNKAEYKLFNSVQHNSLEWLCRALNTGDVLGYDAKLFTQDWLERAEKLCLKYGLLLRPVRQNPFDSIWHDRPAVPQSKLFAYPLEFAGESAASKRARIAKHIAENNASGFLFSQTESIAWLLNLRGDDLPNHPLPLSRLILGTDGLGILFVDPEKVTPEVLVHLGNEVEVRPPEALEEAIRTSTGLAAESDALACHFFSGCGVKLTAMADPCIIPRSLKNETEQAGTRAAHARDGAALASVIAGIKAGDTELEIEGRLRAARSRQQHYRDLSFDAIVGSGANGAIVHYRSNEKTNRATQAGELLLIDSGAQYWDGTTDVTRTIAIGTPSAEMRDRFTRVLKGHIAIARAIFPKGINGHRLDTLARAPLWEIGVDYAHGTGHGVGHYSSVHQVPPRMTYIALSHSALQPGILISNEPGYYKAGEYGIRIENLVLVQKAEIAGAEQETLCFETVTLCPYDRSLIEKSLLIQSEIDWVNTYHQRVFTALSPQVDAATRKWLEAACAPV
jgi:Xaa-Pro aminopeptidase